jgi:hypothetical protein
VHVAEPASANGARRGITLSGGLLLDCVRVAHAWEGVVRVGELELTFTAPIADEPAAGAAVEVVLDPGSVDVWAAEGEAGLVRVEEPALVS